ncbi:hypothetical protein OS175_11770 [Marinicella sp. S1101]|uniref:hypothetical protein n=1 Tax=Marinicella marina TaxID=2996016 RepID=UPI002260F7AA|nr:hypothetical protein [Marinicella marina]MCX7554560.1 hypothetical protein [Marinicella marina]MDJ1141056.1 hypothetical protein [Marinicella marina]
MQTANSHLNWRPHDHTHWFKHMLLPLCLIVVILALPRPWETQRYEAPVLVIDLSQEPVNEPVALEPVEPKLDEPSPLEPLPDKPLAQGPPATEPLTVTSTDMPPAKATETNQDPPQTKTDTTQVTTTVKATDVLRMLQNRPTMELTPEFQARTAPSKDFYIPEQQIMDWYADIPLLDESIDKPKLQMRFYAEGFEGSIEKFFDKVTYRKTFTTKYGTKIHCALIAGVMAACGWK